MTVAERFWSRVDVTPGCWMWTAYRDRKGYGRSQIGRLPRLAHRAAYVLAMGDIPGGQCVRHRCDNPGCVNPAHLELGDNADNVRDRMERGRNRSMSGVQNTRARLTPDRVVEIRLRCAAGDGVGAIAKEMGMSQSAISSLRTGLTWPHVGGPRSGEARLYRRKVAP